MIHVGDIFYSRIWAGRFDKIRTMWKGIVIDVNEMHRHFTVEFDVGEGCRIRETFKMEGYANA